MSLLPTLDDNGDEKKGKGIGLPSIDMPSIEEPEFEEIPVKEALYEDNDKIVNEDIYDEVQRIKDPESELPHVNKDEEDIAEEKDYNPDYESDLKELEEDKFIDKKKKRLIPFGGKKSKGKRFVKSSDFDDRKNKLAKTKVIQFSILAVVVVLFLLGLKNTFLPSHVYTGDQIRQFAAEGAGQTGFPEERGAAYVESFMESYLTIDRTKPELVRTLNYFYGEAGAATSNTSKFNMSWGPEAKQHVIIPPKVFEVELLTEYSAQYKVSAYVSNTDGEVVDGVEPVGRWLSFSVNVYKDVKTDSLVITPDSPSLIPAYRIAEQIVVPERAPFGNGTVNRDIVPALTPTINGFIEAYAKSSVASHESILQYIDDKNDINLYDGFGGAVELNGAPSEAIKKVVYDNDDGVYRVDVTVKWIDTAATQGGNKIEYTSRYIMRVKPIEDGKYSVSSFVPYTYYK